MSSQNKTSLKSVSLLILTVLGLAAIFAPHSTGASVDRLPDTVGLANWVATLSGCPQGGFGENLHPSCDRVHVSSGFFLSDEFRGRGYFAYRFYEVAFDRRPLYAEFVPDMAQVGGPQSPQSELLSKAAYTDAFVKRSEFTNRYNGHRGRFGP